MIEKETELKRKGDIMVIQEVMGWVFIGVYGILFVCWFVFKNWQFLKRGDDLND